MTDWRLVHIPEPELAFGFGQTAEHPKDGLFLYGPAPSNQNPARLDVGVIATDEGLRRYKKWIEKISMPIAEREAGRPENKMMWPGFEAVFGVPWSSKPFAFVEVDSRDIERRIRIGNRHEAVFKAVEIYETALRKHLRTEEAQPQMWFVIVPESVFKYGRPKSMVPKLLREKSETILGLKAGKEILKLGSLFPEEVAAASIYEYELNFHNQLKARLLDTRQVLQVVRETTIGDEKEAETRRSMEDAASVAWNLATTSYYKAGGRPWRVAEVREGVCYVGLVFKKIESARGADNACCGAQMFLGSGEGVVFKGAVGPWYSETDKAFHLKRDKAADLMRMVVESYRDMHGRFPSELFIHGQTYFDDEEWSGFSDSVPNETKLVGVRIRRQNEVKLFRYGKKPVLRGSALIASSRMAYLWTTGFTPRLETYPGREVPNPITVEIVRGEADLELVLSDLMALTKLNFNSAVFADGLPVTLRFADLVGEILTSGPVNVEAPLPFRFYI